MSTQTLADAVIARHNSLKAAQTNWRNLWQDASNYIMPRKGNIETINTPGQDQTTQLFDTTAEEALMVFAAGLLSQLVPPGELWFRYEPKNPDATETYKKWLDDCTDKASKAIYGSNFYLAIHEDFLDAGNFGTSCTYLEEGTKRMLNFCNVPVGTFTLCESNEGMVDTLYREFKWTAKQAEQQWGEAGLSKQLKDALTSSNEKDWDKKFTFIHAVYPRRKSEIRDGQVEGALRPIASVYVCVEDKAVIEESGYYEMPHACSRLLRGNNEAYGRGPGVQVLPEVKMLNRMEQDILLGVERHVNPGWVMPDDSAFRPDNRPGGITYWDATNPNNKPERQVETARIDLGEMKTDQKRARIRSAFFVDMFQMLSNAAEAKREKTAFEVAQMVQEKLVLFSPMFARIVQEKLNPLLERTFNIMLRAGMFTQPPVDMPADASYDITYVSKIALAIKAAQNNALMDLLQICNAMVPFDNSVAMVVDWRKAFREVARNRGTPADWMRDDEDVDEMLDQMQKAQQAMQAAQTMEMASRSAKNLGPEAQKQATDKMANAAV